jgi:hypothetical protein
MRFYILFGLIFLGRTGMTQPLSGIKADIEVGTWATSAKTMPFWLKANQNGMVPDRAPSGTLRLGVAKHYNQHDSSTSGKLKRWDWGFGFNPLVNLSQNAKKLVLAQGYVNLKYRALELLVGRRNSIIGIGDSTLSSGFMVVSGNAMAIPKLLLSTRSFVPIKYLHGFFAVNAGFAHGWYNDPYIQGAFLHQKYLYVRLGTTKSRFKAYGGLHHEVIWGGSAEYLRGRPDLATDGKLPSSWKNYGNVLLGTVPKPDANLAVFDNDYRIGDHIGSFDAGLEASTSLGMFLLYHQHLFDDLSGLVFQNFPDGLTGFSWHRRRVNVSPMNFRIEHLTVEYLSTLSQSGRTFLQQNSHFQGNDNYFNHAQYNQGWSYLGKTIGTPFIMPWKDLAPNISTPRADFFPNNRIQVIYAGVQGGLGQNLKFMTRFSFSGNYGTSQHPYLESLRQFSYLLMTELKVPRLHGIQFALSVAGDQGKLLTNNTGVFIRIRKAGWLFGQSGRYAESVGGVVVNN